MNLFDKTNEFAKLANKKSLLEKVLAAQKEAEQACNRARELYIQYLKENG